VGLKFSVIAVNERHRRALREQRAAQVQWNRDGRIASDSVLELSSVDMTVAFFDDRLEFRRRLGSKHGVVHYSELEAVRLAATSPSMIHAAPNPALAPSHARTEVILITASRAGPLIFDFRSESAQKVHEAIAIMRRGMPRASDATDEHLAFANGSPSRADELMKLARLRSLGVLTDKEFEREKARILNP
jgi:hypothetical protein